MSPGTRNIGVGFGHGAETEMNVDEGLNQTVTENLGWGDKPKMLASTAQSSLLAQQCLLSDTKRVGSLPTAPLL